ncbi:MAG: DUF4394 domain-containing protein [Planctomycetales bacterium]|nr:DUF4394 domain-containing protein [Planctomycetales bacterium]
MKIFRFTLFVVIALLFAQSNKASAERLFGLTTQNWISVFDSSAPGNTIGGGAVTGLETNDILTAMDYQPATGNVLLLGTLNNVYQLNSTSGTDFSATLLNTLDPTLVGTSMAFDFNPAFMEGAFARIISDTNDNRVIGGADGQYLSPVEKTDVFYAAGDANEGVDPNIAGIAYDSNVAGASSTQQYGIDASLGILTTVANNAGTLETIGSLGLAGNLTNELGFDISGETGTAFASFQTGPNSHLYTVDLSTGGATAIGQIGSGDLIRDITTVPIPEPSSALLLLIGMLGLTRRLRS